MDHAVDRHDYDGRPVLAHLMGLPPALRDTTDILDHAAIPPFVAPNLGLRRGASNSGT